MYNVDALLDFDSFFFYGDNDLFFEIESDLIQLLLQEPRSLFYNRKESADLRDNKSHSLKGRILTRTNIVESIMYKNSVVVDGTNGQKDRRIAVSQLSIDIQDNKALGEQDITVLYIPLANFEAYNSLKVPTGFLQ